MVDWTTGEDEGLQKELEIQEHERERKFLSSSPLLFIGEEGGDFETVRKTKRLCAILTVLILDMVH